MTENYFFCPNSECKNHSLDVDQDDWYKKNGFHSTKAFGRVQRYFCFDCETTFSDQTFLLNYYLKRKTDFSKLKKTLMSHSSICFTARNLKLSEESLQLRIERLSRNALFLQSKMLENFKFKERLVADGLESYVTTKNLPTHHNILIGQKSDFIYFFTQSHQRRKGRSTGEQKKKSSQLYTRADFSRSRISDQFRKLLEFCSTHSSPKKKDIVLHTDEHPIYEQQIKKFNESHSYHRIKHHQTHSSEPRTRDNPLRAANYFDRQVRKDIPEHRRKSICFGRDARNMNMRFALYVVIHNFFKPKKIISKAAQVKERHFSEAGLNTKIALKWKALFDSKRFFLSHCKMNEYLKEIWMKECADPLKANTAYLPKFAAW
jgi:transposase-like protein